MNEPRPEGAPAAAARRRRGDGGRRERLLEMATREFAAKGLAGARVDAIARAARSNKQLVYYYFGNKIGLYNEVVGRIGPIVHEELYPDIDSDESLTLVERVRRRATHTWGPVAARWGRLLGWEALERGDATSSASSSATTTGATGCARSRPPRLAARSIPASTPSCWRWRSWPSR